MILKYDFDPQELAQDDASARKAKLSKYLSELENNYASIDALVLTSKDPFISEYVPLSNNPRFGATAFTGSVGDAVYWTQKFRDEYQQRTGQEHKAVSLFVDGRYHLQADTETPSDLVEIVKLGSEPMIEGALRERLAQTRGMTIGIDFERTSVATLDRFKEMVQKSGSSLLNVGGEQVLFALGLKGWKVDRQIFSLPESATGRTFSKNLVALGQAMQQAAGTREVLHMTCATDDAAFLMNARGFHLPNSSSFLAYTFFSQNEFIVFLPASSRACKLHIDDAQIGEFRLTVIRDDGDQLREALKRHSVKKVLFNGSTMNGLLPSLVKEVFPKAEFQSNFTWILKTRTQKTPQEMNSIRSSFIRSSKAIANTLRWGKGETQKRDVSEVELADHLKQSYASQGAVSLSFDTISGAGPNSAIVHYHPKPQYSFKMGQLALLDSGAYYAEGFATDCTRGFFVGQKDSGVIPEAWQTKIYTATLKSAIQVFMKPVDAKWSGKEVDASIRGVVRELGYEYAHGTGHGVGIHVHEEGIRLSPLSIYGQTAYACVSVEPGIYLKDQGGVRVENIALLIPEGSTHFRYENVVFVGYDWDLIDLNALTTEEKAYLKTYEAKCRELGTQLMDCPL